MTIKVQIATLIKQMQDTFYKETGIVLIAYPDTAVKRIPLTRLKQLSDRFFNLNVYGRSRMQEVLDARSMFLHIAREMGYTPSVIARETGMDRTSIMARQKGKRQYDTDWKELYGKYKKYLMEEI